MAGEGSGQRAYLIAEAGINLQAIHSLGVGERFAMVFTFADEATLDQAMAAVGGACCGCG